MAETLTAFLEDLEADLAFVVGNARDLLPGHQEGVYTSLEGAWSEVQERDEFDHNEFDRLIQDVKRDDYGEQLYAHGLGEDQQQLNFKLRSVAEYRSGFKFIKDSWEDFRELSDSVKSKISGPILSSYFGAANVVLKSLIDAVGGSEAIQELKDFIESLLPF